MNKLISILLVSLVTTSAFARDYFQEDKYTNPRPRGVDSVYDEPRTSGYGYRYQTRSEPSSDSYSQSYSKGSTSDRYQINNHGLIIRKDQ